MKKCFVSLVVSCLSLVASTSFAQVRMTRIVPADGPPGTNVTIHGSGFTAPAEVTIDGIAANVTRTTATNVTFTVPANARSGVIVLTTGGESFPYGIPFQVTRPVQGVLNFPAGVNRAGYNILVNGTQPPINPADGTFTAFVPVDAVAYVWAYRQSHQPAFLAVIMPDMGSVTVDARSTAEALVLSLPGVTTRDAQTMMTLRSVLDGLAQLTALEDLVVSASAAGRDYLDDARLLEAWLNAVTALASQPAPMRVRNVSRAMAAPEAPRGTFFKYINPPAGYHGYPDLRRLQMNLNDRAAQHPTDYRLKIESAGRFSPIENPVDWFVELYELDPRQFTNGLASVSALTHESTPRKLRGTAERTAIVSASLFSKNLDLLDVAAGKLTDWWLGSSLTNHLPNRFPGVVVAPDEIPISSLTPGVYVVEAYSGNVFWGTGIFNDSPPSQSDLITSLQNRQAWGVSLGANMVVAAVDGVPVVADMFGFIQKTRTNRAGDDDNEPEEQMKLAQDIAWGVGQDLIKAIAIHGNDLANRQVAYDLFKTAVSSIIKNTSGKLMENAPELVDAPGFIAKSLKFVGKTLDVFGKASSFLQATERVTGLFANSVLAVERSVIVVGDPFGPKIESFMPQTGRGGEILTIVGYNFPTNTNNVRVSFCQFASTSDPNEITSQIVVPVYDIHPTSISVRVPTNGPAMFPNLRAALCVEVLDKDFRGTTQSLDPPYREFIFIGPPELTAVRPDAVFPGGLLELQGRNLSPDVGAYRVYVDGSRDGFVQLATTNSLMVQVPTFTSTGLHSIAVQVLDLRSAPVNFTIKDLTLGTPGQFRRGLSIRVTKPDFSNVADGEISILEGALIANGTLGRAIERHLPCESLPPDDPQACPRQRREEDNIQNLDDGPNGGPASADYVFLDSSITNGTVATGVLPPLSSGDSYVLRMIIDGGGATSSGLVLDGASEVQVDGLTLRNYGSHGVWLRNGASFNALDNITIENCGGSGAFLDGSARNNDFFGLSVSNAASHGLHLSGPDVRLNVIEGAGGRPPIFGGEVRPYTHYMKCGGNGIRIDGGASFNNILPGTVRENLGAGILITGTGTGNNFVGRGSDELVRDYDVVKNGGPGVHLTDGVQNCVVRYINAAGNEGDGILLEGPDCANNQVDRCIVGVNRYEGGTPLDLPNQGSGIHLRGGAHHNLIGTEIISFGDYGAIGGNRDDGILIEGSETAYNTVNAQQIGLHSVYYENGFLRLRFLANGLAGIRLRDGAHHNTIGSSEYDLPNFIFSSPEAAIVLEGAATRQNIVFGNQIGTYHQQLSFNGPGQNNVGIWIKDGANANTIGRPGEPVGYPRFPPFGPLDGAKVFWNVIARCVTAGILIENSGGQVGTDGILRNANIVQNNLLGEEERFAIAPNATGIKLGPGAFANVIGGPLPFHRNRIRGNWRAGIWIQDNHVPSPSMRNRVQNNFIAEQGITGFLRYPGYLTETPSGGIGLLIENSSGHVFGEDLQTTNLLNFNRLGIYLANSSSNIIQGNWVSNHFVAGIVVRGGSGNLIGGEQPELGNQVSGFGLNDAGQGGVVLSHTTENIVAGNFIGFVDPGRGGVGLLITNSSFNQIGVGPPRAGNVIAGNSTNGVLLTGPETLGNDLLGNYVGVTRIGRVLSNRLDGVRIEAGANHNRIGGYADIPGAMPPQSIPAGNIIAGNIGAGVRVDGAASIGNSILFNSISGNGGKGIAHSTGGNQLIPPPTFVNFDGIAVSGNVPDLGVIPPGSVVQIFCDPDPSDPEGDLYLGQGVVSTTGVWRATLVGPLIHDIITMTSSHGVTGSTSEFGTGTTTPIGFHIERTDGITEERVPAGAVRAPVFRLSLTAVNADVRVHSIAFDIAGSLADVQAVSGASIYWDLDQDGRVGPSDQFLAGPAQFTAEDGRITLNTTNALVDGNTTQRWLLAFDLAANAPLGAQFRLTVTNAQAVDAEFVYPARLRAVPAGNFAINSAEFTIGEPTVRQTIAAWKQTVFTAAQLADPNTSGDTSDPDGDGYNNVLEYAFNLDPLVADRTVSSGERGAPRPVTIRLFNPDIGAEQDYFGVEFVRRKPPVDLNYYVQDSRDLLSWGDSVQSSAVDLGDGTLLERVTYQAAQPKGGPGAAPQQFIHVRVELVP